MKQRQNLRRYVLVNYTPIQKTKIQSIIHTHSYNFSELFNNKHRKGLIVTENRDFYDIIRSINMDYELKICPLTDVHVIYLNP